LNALILGIVGPNYGSARGGNHRISLDVTTFRRRGIIAW
jgi:hypothetical protein